MFISRFEQWPVAAAVAGSADHKATGPRGSAQPPLAPPSPGGGAQLQLFLTTEPLVSSASPLALPPQNAIPSKMDRGSDSPPPDRELDPAVSCREPLSFRIKRTSKVGVYRPEPLCLVPSGTFIPKGNPMETDPFQRQPLNPAVSCRELP